MNATEPGNRTLPGRPDDWYPAVPVRSSSNAAAFLSKRPTTVIAGGVGMATALLIVVVVLLSRSDQEHAKTAAHHRDRASGAANVQPYEAGVADPCRGFNGDLVTNHDGDQTSPLNVVAALEYAFYVKRDADAVTALYLPSVLAADAKAGIAGFIAHIPDGVRYCVAATMAGTNVVNYDVRDIRPDPDSRESAVPITNNFAMTLTVTSSAPYLISTLHPRK